MQTKNLKQYYGDETPTHLSYLEFGNIDLQNAKKEIWGYWHHQDAYDLYMFSRYARDLFLFRDFIASGNYTMDEFVKTIAQSAHTKLLDYMLKFAGMLTLLEMGLTPTLCESGSSLYGLIDEAIALDLALFNGKHGSSFKKLKYLCSDISVMMNKGAEAFHPEISFQFSTQDTVAGLMQEVDKLGMFYGLSVSLRYALRSASDLLTVAQKTDLVVLNRLSVHLGETISVYAGTGKNAFLISLYELEQLLSENGIYAIYCTENMQKEKDTKNSLRVSMVFSKKEDVLRNFTNQYANCMKKIEQEPSKDLWLPLKELVEQVR